MDENSTQRETKTIQTKAKKDGDRIITGICAVFGNVDDWGDRIHPGAFTKTLEGRARAKHLWNHNFGEPPTAKILELKEIGRDELPEEILKYAPMATGGLLVKREYLNNPDAEKVLQGILEGTINEMSFGFNATKYDYTVEGEKEIREIREVKLFDTSDVNFGMNDATLAQKNFNGMSAEMVLACFPTAAKEFLKEMKSGRRNAASDANIIKNIHEAVVGLGFDGCELKTDETSEKSKVISEKSDEAEAAKVGTSLQTKKLELMKFELDNF